MGNFLGHEIFFSPYVLDIFWLAIACMGKNCFFLTSEILYLLMAPLHDTERCFEQEPITSWF